MNAKDVTIVRKELTITIGGETAYQLECIARERRTTVDGIVMKALHDLLPYETGVFGPSRPKLPSGDELRKGIH